MTFIAFSDQHLGSKLYNSPELENDNRKLFTKVIDLCIELQPDYLVSVGDLFDNNKPSSDLIEFVASELRRLHSAYKTRAVAIAGDHSKPVDGHTWEKICGFSHIATVPEFAGVDYSDNPEDVLQQLNMELNRRERDSVEFIFMHQQIPELWPFCDDKKKISLKDLDFSKHCNSLKGIFLGDIHIRREMRYLDPICNREVFVGYCGSLGVTASNETNKPGIYYWNEGELQLIAYELPRQYVTLNVTADNLNSFKEADFQEKYADSPTRPVFICCHSAEVSKNLDQLNFLYRLGIVRFSKTRTNETTEEEYINIRSELKTEERISEVLKAMTNGKENSDQLYTLSYKLLTNQDPTVVLDEVKIKLLDQNV
jgi:hypothetical protein